MKISYKTDYALKTILDLSHHKDKKVVNIADIAERQDIPPKFLEQILLTLKSAGVVASKRGPSGGYFLTLAPNKITLAQIIRIFEGSLAPISCASKSCYSHCNYENTCPFRENWLNICEYISSTLNNINFQDMVNRENVLKMKNKPLEYVI